MGWIRNDEIAGALELAIIGQMQDPTRDCRKAGNRCARREQCVFEILGDLHLALRPRSRGHKVGRANNRGRFLIGRSRVAGIAGTIPIGVGLI